jgi:hypothetical protein
MGTQADEEQSIEKNAIEVGFVGDWRLAGNPSAG